MGITSINFGVIRFQGHMQGGIYSFMKVPIIENPIENELRFQDVKVAVLGVPLDGGVMSRVGQSCGPRAIREASQSFFPYSPEYDVYFAEKFNMRDCSDAYIYAGNVKKSIENSGEVAAEILKADALPVILGGEHTVSLVGALATEQALPGKYGFIHLDSHIDTDEFYMPEGWNQGNQVAHISKLESFPTENMVMIGIRGFSNLKMHFDWCNERGISVYTMMDVLKKGVEQVFDEALKIATRGTDGFYLTVDLDVLDPAYAPGVCDPVPNGLTSRELWTVLPEIGASDKLKALDIV